ncbi:MAG: hypothetical protein EOO91_15845 [Pedobacter sp.]|nr:MAG: hypothetical protein EOO91_15845 [Pedobacter sp.]
MATFRIVLGIVCFAFLGRLVEPGGDILRVGLKNKEQRVKNIEQRNKLITIAQSQLGVREATGNNDGIQVEKYLNYTGNKKGEPWCASFVSWVYGQAGFAQPKTAWSPNLFPLAQQ